MCFAETSTKVRKDWKIVSNSLNTFQAVSKHTADVWVWELFIGHGKSTSLNVEFFFSNFVLCLYLLFV